MWISTQAAGVWAGTGPLFRQLWSRRVDGHGVGAKRGAAFQELREQVGWMLEAPAFRVWAYANLQVNVVPFLCFHLS